MSKKQIKFNREELSPLLEYLTIKGRSEKTRMTIARNTSYFIHWAKEQDIEPEQASYNDVMAYISYCKKKGNKQRTLQVIINALKHYFMHLMESEVIADNPASHILIRGIKRKVLHDTFSAEELEEIYRRYPSQALIEKRNKIMLGLIIYQGIRPEELGRLEVGDIKLHEGKIHIAGARRTEERELKLEPHQIMSLSDYINETRKMLLAITGKQTPQLFTSIGSGSSIHNALSKLAESLRKQNPKIKDIKQLRISVIVGWLKVHNLRKAQYMAGHRYVSSTEGYQQNNMDDLQADVEQFHPIG